MPNAFATQGTLLKQNGTTISKRTKIKPAPQNHAKIDTTDLDASAYTSIPGLMNCGELECEINFNPLDSTHAALTTSLNAGNIDTWVIAYANSSSTDSFSGWISSFEPSEAVVDGLQKATLKIQVTGVITRAA